MSPGGSTTSCAAVPAVRATPARAASSCPWRTISLRLFGSERIQGMMETRGVDEDTPLDQKMLSNAIESAQKRVGVPETSRPVRRCWSTTT